MSLICLVLLIFSTWYVPFRLKRLCGLKRAWPLTAAIFLLLAGFYGMLVTGLCASVNPLFAAAYIVLGFFLIFHVYLFIYLFAVNLSAPFLRKPPAKGLAALGLFVCLGLVCFGFIQAQSFKVTNHEIRLRGITGPVTIMHVSDLHLGAQRREGYLEKLVETLGRYQPDIVLYNGDMLDSDIALTPELFAWFGLVEAEQYFTTGNHEFYINTEKALQLIADAGIRVLRNEMTETHGIQLIGLEYMNADRATYDSHRVNDLTIEEELPKIVWDESKPAVLVHHSPVGLEYVSNENIDLMLSGHTHGGQVFPGTVLIRFRFPMNKGLHRIGETLMLISQGAGTFGPWMRLGTFNEIQFIKLVPE
jgi:predicted MPP superfamily phosphohydrolase